MDEMNFGVDRLLHIVRRRAKLVALCNLAALLLGIFIASLLRNEYAAIATVLVEPQTISRTLLEDGPEAAKLQNRLHLMSMQILARERLSRVIDEFNLYPDEHQEMTRLEVIDLMRDQIGVEPVLPELDRRLFARTEPEINTFRLSFRHESPATSANVANRLANDFIDQHLRERSEISGDTAVFLEAELQRLEEQLAAKQQEIAAFKDEKNGRLPEDRPRLERRVEHLSASMSRSQDAIAEATADATYWRQQALAAAQADQDEADPARRVQLLEIGLAEMRARGLTDRHPDVVKATEEIAELRAIMGSEVFGSSAPQRSAEAQAQRAEDRASAARAELQRFADDLADSETRLAETPAVAKRLEALENEEQSLLASVHEFRQKGVDASVAANMVQDLKGEQFRVLERAVPPPEPASPNRPLIIVLAATLGLAIGVGIAVVLELFETSLHDPRDAQEALGVPVLASVPMIALESDRRILRRRRMLEAVGVAAVSGVVLIGSLIAYLAVNAPNAQSEEESQPPTLSRSDAGGN